ncbi:hypothetical protein GIB67_031511 [Kingdonia uniflora]|uniref:Uncharacterized protein n=1 Tax=Kingdonia uniflora TaxID=39325 RepID=A0A7J7MNM9_9MAGN|nr:hypothetical protein GIB67_031511 [Kingdonia uniflora]
MPSISSCAKADEADLVRQLTPVIGVGDEENTVAELIEWPRLKGSRVEYPTGSSRFREFCKAKSSIDEIWGKTFAYRGNFFRTCSVSQGGDYLYLPPDLAQEKKCRRLGDEVSLELTLPLSNLAKSAMNWIGACPKQLNCNFLEVILVCETLNGRWTASGSERRITAKDFLEYYAVKYVTATDGAYLSSSSSRPCFFDLSSAGRVWNDNLLWVSGINCKVSGKESFIDVVAREGTKLEAILKELEISWFKRVASKDDKVRRSQAKRRLAGKTSGSIEEKLSTPELNTPLKLVWLIEILDGPVDVATVSSTVVRNLTKRKAVKRGVAPRLVMSVSVDDSSKRKKVTSPIKSQDVLEESDKIAEGADLRPHFKVEAGLLEEQCRPKAREKMVAVMDDEFKKVDGAGKEDLPARGGEKSVGREPYSGEGNFLVGAGERKGSCCPKTKGRKLYQLRYTKAEIMAFSEGNYKEMEIMDEEEVEEREDGLNVAEKTAADNQEIEGSRLRVEDLESMLEVEKKNPLLNWRTFVYVPSVLRPKLVIVGRPRRSRLSRACRFLYCKFINIAREIEEQTLLYNAEYAEEYEVLFSQYEDRLDDNVKLSFKLEEAKRQVEQKTATILSRDLALNQLTKELAELKEKVASGSWHEAELPKYRIRALNEEISDMKCNIRALNEQLLKREIELDTARTNLAVSEADFEKLSSSIMGKDQELRNSDQIRDSLIVRLDRVKADLRRLKGREAQSRADLAEIQAKNKSLVDDLAHARGNVRRAM